MMSSRDVLVFRVGLFTRVALLTFPLELIPRILLQSIFFVCVFFLVLHTLWSRSGGVLRFLVLACPETYT